MTSSGIKTLLLCADGAENRTSMYVAWQYLPNTDLSFQGDVREALEDLISTVTKEMLLRGVQEDVVDALCGLPTGEYGDFDDFWGAYSEGDCSVGSWSLLQSPRGPLGCVIGVREYFQGTEGEFSDNDGVPTIWCA